MVFIEANAGHLISLPEDIFPISRTHCPSYQGPRSGTGVAQESFFLACRAHRQYNPSKDLVPWLFQIARNIAYKEYNVRKSGNTVSLDETMQDSAYEPVANTPNPRQQVAEQEMWNRIHKALYRMKPKYRDVLILRLIQGLPSEQVASMLNLPVATVNTHTHRALKLYGIGSERRTTGR